MSKLMYQRKVFWGALEVRIHSFEQVPGVFVTAFLVKQCRNSELRNTHT